MSKYDGIKVVDTRTEEISRSTEKKAQAVGGSFLSGFIMRIVAGALILGGLFSIRLIDHPIAQKAVESVKSMVTYDMNKRDSETFGEIKFVELIKEYQNISEQENSEE